MVSMSTKGEGVDVLWSKEATGSVNKGMGGPGLDGGAGANQIDPSDVRLPGGDERGVVMVTCFHSPYLSFSLIPPLLLHYHKQRIKHLTKQISSPQHILYMYTYAYMNTKPYIINVKQTTDP